MVSESLQWGWFVLCHHLAVLQHRHRVTTCRLNRRLRRIFPMVALLIWACAASVQSLAAAEEGAPLDVPGLEALLAEWVHSSATPSSESFLRVFEHAARRYGAPNLVDASVQLHRDLLKRESTVLASLVLVYVGGAELAGENEEERADGPAASGLLRTIARDGLSLLAAEQAGIGSEVARMLAYAAVEVGRLDLAARSWGNATSAFEASLAFSPREARALLGLGYVQEVHGRKEQAIPFYARSARRLDESQLRLATSLFRLGRGSDAAPILRNLGENSAQTWIRTVAWQELALLLLGDGELEAAASALAEGLGQSPSDERLQTLLAFVAESRGDRASAQRIISEEWSAVRTKDLDARVRYSRPPHLAPGLQLERKAEQWRSTAVAVLQDTLVRGQQ